MTDVIILPPVAAPPSATEKPFRIIHRGGLSLYTNQGDNAGVRPCDHSRFVLDEKWATVTCQDCKAKIDPFAVLMRYAEWGERIESERRHLERDRVDQMRIQILGMLERKQFDADRLELRKRIDRAHYGKKALEDMRTLHKEVSTRVDVDREARAAKLAASRKPDIGHAE